MINIKTIPWGEVVMLIALAIVISTLGLVATGVIKSDYISRGEAVKKCSSVYDQSFNTIEIADFRFRRCLNEQGYTLQD